MRGNNGDEPSWRHPLGRRGGIGLWTGFVGRRHIGLSVFVDFGFVDKQKQTAVFVDSC